MYIFYTTHMDFMKLFLFNMVVYSIFLNPLIGEEYDENTLYAFSSLNTYLNQELSEKSYLSIPFEDEDIESLWSRAEENDALGEVSKAKYYSDKKDFYAALKHLNHAWNHQLDHIYAHENPFLNKNIKSKITPYLIPETHPKKVILDNIFSTTRVTSNLETLEQAGFQITHIKDSSFIIVAKHPSLKNYLFKLYLDSDSRTRLNKPSWQWLVDRCRGAQIIRTLIKKKKIKHFVVPKKWLYILPPIPAQGTQHLLVLLAEDMRLVSKSETKEAWKTVVTPEHLDELYCILSHGCGSNFLSSNVPYTQDGKFTFIDTEYPHRKINLEKIKLYIDPQLHEYWDNLVKTGNKRK